SSGSSHGRRRGEVLTSPPLCAGRGRNSSIARISGEGPGVAIAAITTSRVIPASKFISMFSLSTILREADVRPEKLLLKQTPCPARHPASRAGRGDVKKAAVTALAALLIIGVPLRTSAQTGAPVDVRILAINDFHGYLKPSRGGIAIAD